MDLIRARHQEFGLAGEAGDPHSCLGIPWGSASAASESDRRTRTRRLSFFCRADLNRGIAQKLLNLYLKYLWCVGYIVEPPHCPIDRIIIGKTSFRDRLNWTEMGEAEYREVIGEMTSLARSKGFNAGAMGVGKLPQKETVRRRWLAPPTAFVFFKTSRLPQLSQGALDAKTCAG
jgi:hypothetical protein